MTVAHFNVNKQYDIFNKKISIESKPIESKKEFLVFPNRFERFDKEKHSDYFKYLTETRKISEKKIDKLKLFVEGIGSPFLNEPISYLILNFLE